MQQANGISEPVTGKDERERCDVYMHIQDGRVRIREKSRQSSRLKVFVQRSSNTYPRTLRKMAWLCSSSVGRSDLLAIDGGLHLLRWSILGPNLYAAGNTRVNNIYTYNQSRLIGVFGTGRINIHLLNTMRTGSRKTLTSNLLSSAMNAIKNWVQITNTHTIDTKKCSPHKKSVDETSAHSQCAHTEAIQEWTEEATQAREECSRTTNQPTQAWLGFYKRRRLCVKQGNECELPAYSFGSTNGAERRVTSSSLAFRFEHTLSMSFLTMSGAYTPSSCTRDDAMSEGKSFSS